MENTPMNPDIKSIIIQNLGLNQAQFNKKGAVSKARFYKILRDT